MKPKELLRYIQILEKRVEQVEKYIRKIAKKKLGKEEVDKHPDTIYLIYHLHEMDQRAELQDSLIKNELQSYDLLQNERYSRLRELKNVLDTDKSVHHHYH